MYKQIDTYETVTLNNGSELKPVATLASESGGVAHIYVDDHCYVLGLESVDRYSEGGAGEVFVHPTHYIFAEAFDVMKKLPSLSRA